MEENDRIRRLFDRDETVLAEIAAEYGPRCRKIAGNILSSPEDTEEVVNDTWLRLWASVPPARPAVLGAYVSRITRNLAINRYHQNRAACRDPGVLTDWEALAENPDLFETAAGQDPVAESAEAAELAGSIGAFLDSLCAEDRVLFVKRYYYMTDTDSIVREMGLRANTVHQKLRRMRERLRKYLTERGYMI